MLYIHRASKKPLTAETIMPFLLMTFSAPLILPFALWSVLLKFFILY
jgi:hypothetical protein